MPGLEIFGGFAVIVAILAILATIFWIWMLIDCLQNPRLQGAEKVIWIVVILFLHLLGALIYYFVGKQPRTGGL